MLWEWLNRRLAEGCKEGEGGDIPARGQNQNSQPLLHVALLMMPQVQRVMVLLILEEMAKEEAVELAKEKAELQAEE